MSEKLTRLRTLLAELFQFDRADLDFGIYRIMNQKREEITKFLDEDLLPQVKESFQQYQPADKTHLQKELDEMITSLKNAGVEPDQSPKVQDLRKQLSESIDITALEDEVYSALYSFFRRYYDKGDFISKRRYKEGVYAIPYEGEEVKLHWANHDQYYIKTTEYLRDYTFKLKDNKKVHFKLVEADTDKDNNKTNSDKERKFFLRSEESVSIQENELYIYFEYRPDTSKKKQDALNEEARQTILSTDLPPDWLKALETPAPPKSTISKNKNRTILEKHLTEYTARNTFDYFIHKDLGKFLRRELDFYSTFERKTPL